MDNSGTQSPSISTPPTKESVVKEVMETGSLKLWGLRQAKAVSEELMTSAELDHKLALLDQAAKEWKAAGMPGLRPVAV